MKLANSNGRQNERRINVLNRLKTQLKSGSKTGKKSVTGLDLLPLTEQDVKRIEKEIKVLETRIVAPEIARATRTKRKK